VRKSLEVKEYLVQAKARDRAGAYRGRRAWDTRRSREGGAAVLPALGLSVKKRSRALSVTKARKGAAGMSS